MLQQSHARVGQRRVLQQGHARVGPRRVQGQQKWTEALADTARAIALQPSYCKARSRHAALLHTLRCVALEEAALRALKDLPADAGEARDRRRRHSDAADLNELSVTCDHFAVLGLPSSATVPPSPAAPCRTGVGLFSVDAPCLASAQRCADQGQMRQVPTQTYEAGANSNRGGLRGSDHCSTRTVLQTTPLETMS